MQATVMRFDPHQQSGDVVLDDGTQIPFGQEAFAASGLRLLRPGQRVRLVMHDDTLVWLTIVTLAEPPVS
jgi:cold shock CspA family protein